EPARGRPDRAALPDPGCQRHVPRERPRPDRGRPGAARGQRGRGEGTSARDPRRGRGGVHAVSESAPPLRALEPRAAHRPLGAAELGRDPARDRRPRARRPGVRGGTHRPISAARRVLLARAFGALPLPGVEQLLHVPPLFGTELEAGEQPPSLGHIVVFDRRLKVLAGRDRLPQRASQPAEEAYLRGFHTPSVAAGAGRYRSAARSTISVACSAESWSVLTTRS